MHLSLLRGRLWLLHLLPMLLARRLLILLLLFLVIIRTVRLGLVYEVLKTVHWRSWQLSFLALAKLEQISSQLQTNSINFVPHGKELPQQNQSPKFTLVVLNEEPSVPRLHIFKNDLAVMATHC